MAKITPLSHWLTAAPNNIIAVHIDSTRHIDSTVTTEDFLLRVQCWFETLNKHEGSRWALYHSDAFEFLAILFALWQLKRTACTPGDNRPGTLKRLTTHVDGFVGEFPGEAITACDIPEGRSDLKPWRTLMPEFLALEIYTSGSTGEPKPIGKTIAQLEQEIEVLESRWPSLPGSVTLATVSHQHIYGMMFRLLWPFCVGQAFSRQICQYPEDILHQAKPHRSFSLISSPSHLGRLNVSMNWKSLSGHCRYVISSAAPLKREDSLLVSQLLNAQIFEIYGSSETGAIAWRTQQEHHTDALWQPLPKVSLAPDTDGTLCVTSPYLGTANSFSLPDRVEFNRSNQFKLIGRVDRIVKIEGKRVSLTAIEQQLLENTLVKNAKALTVERKRVETAAVIELTSEGWRQLKSHGRKPLIKTLKGILAQHFEAVILPRRWRFVEQLPYNQQGKLPLDILQSMFIDEPVKWPKIIHQQVSDNQLTIQCYIPAELIYFDGHFDNNPILPGITQVHWAEAFGRQLLSVTGSFEGLEAIKFQKVIPPGQQISINLTYDETQNKLRFQYASQNGVHSSGRICFG
ncbi:AMP-binding protein [Motiliproteus sp. MSK22-1]|uniref:AMP-binding protein n=1 Tax=Motiliproteus sp. MSK22-1 TaxID=1897630 RepID=UPI0009778BBC|nr:AMP-binding protein [Motiliproteus sp. MSK22-1]OMH31687.1 hypothetical protein BGP75_16305 [Motiliproteus sp. MSK22-1]